ncbi:ATP-binding cassette domain-containing protein [Parvibaculum sedimenti]|uniref:ATP-binding cassette domain-containing protein n=1 Tax=Parvibaculum sedimenti TaxID=2608632 RepID=A0A6N6VL33_9HYPH|nr:ATP-binding cassette domain-containing protein [Parvibaculum sedimenti]
MSRRFGPVTAVDGVTLSVAAGEIFGLLGRNGAGKSTLIKMLTTLLPPSSGSAQVAGFDIEGEAAKVRRVIGYVPQALSADGELTGRENLDIFARLYDIPSSLRKARVGEGLEFMGLGDSADRLVATYSGGMIRRLEIAQSMLHRPQVLFLDEPTVGLDPVAREAVWEHIIRLRQSFKTTIILTTHYMDEAEKLCDRIAIMQQGKLAAAGTIAELRAATGDETASLTDLFTRLTGNAAEAGGGYAATAGTRQTAERLG